LELRAIRTSVSYLPAIASFIFGLWRRREIKRLCEQIVGISRKCRAEADAIAKEHSHPLGDKPLVDVSTDGDRSPDYVKLQNDLLSLSQNSKELIAENSGHFVIIDRPDVVIDAISQVVQSVRNKAKLLKQRSAAEFEYFENEVSARPPKCLINAASSTGRCNII